jgi:hypothetical protein
MDGPPNGSGLKHFGEATARILKRIVEAEDEGIPHEIETNPSVQGKPRPEMKRRAVSDETTRRP